MTTVFYNSYAQEPLYDMIRGVMPPGFNLLTLTAEDARERIEKLARADVVIVAATPLTRDLIAAASRLVLVHHQGVGYHDTVDTVALSKRGIPLALTPQGTTEAVAEMAILLMLAVLRRLPYADAGLRRGRWHINVLRPESGNLRNRTVGYIGMGRIGQATARLASAFGVSGLYFDPLVTLKTQDEEALNLRKVALETLLGEADIVSLHLPFDPARGPVIDQDAIAMMKPGAVVINTARGKLIDEPALAAALGDGRLGGAGLDVYAPEPPLPDNPLLAFRNTVLTPHISGGTRDAFETKMRAIFDNIGRFRNGMALRNQVKLPNPAAVTR